MTSFARIATAAAALSLLAAPSYAQNLNTSANGTYGQVEFNSNFYPDPYHVSVLAGGAVDATRANESCTGFIAARPSFTLRYRAGEFPLYIAAESDADATIAVRAPDGSWHCDDDSGGNLNPLVSWESPRSGRYQIWVGRFGMETETAPALLHISEAGGPEQLTAERPDYSLDPAYGAVELAAGFMPDPHVQAISAGGSIDASSIQGPGCVGFIARAPDYRLHWTTNDEGPLTFSVTSGADTTLVINDANANWICNDDSDGFNPSITFEHAPSGQYDIWVGTYASGELQDSELRISELH